MNGPVISRLLEGAADQRVFWKRNDKYRWYKLKCMERNVANMTAVFLRKEVRAVLTSMLLIAMVDQAVAGIFFLLCRVYYGLIVM